MITEEINNLSTLNRDNTKKYQDCLLKRGEHDYFSIDFQYLSKNVIETKYICLDCADLNYVYNYIEEDDQEL